MNNKEKVQLRLFNDKTDKVYYRYLDDDELYDVLLRIIPREEWKKEIGIEENFLNTKQVK